MNMKRRVLNWAAAVVMAVVATVVGVTPVAAQTAQSYGVIPDCVLYFNFTAAGSSSTYMNYPAPSGTGGGVCTAWVMSYTAYGFSALTLTFQSAGTMAGSQITPGAWGTYSGTVVTGTNPATTTTGAQVYFANDTVSTPFVRVNLSGLTGSGRVWGAVYGYKTGSTGGGGGPTTSCPGTTGTPCVVEGVDANGATTTAMPVLTGAWNGSTTQNDYVCNSSAAITFTASSGSVQVVGLTASQVIRICSISLSSDTATNITFQYGTGSNCGTGTTALSGAYQNVLSLALNLGPAAALRTAASNAFCVNSSASATIGGLVTYAKF